MAFNLQNALKQVKQEDKRISEQSKADQSVQSAVRAATSAQSGGFGSPSYLASTVSPPDEVSAYQQKFEAAKKALDDYNLKNPVQYTKNYDGSQYESYDKERDRLSTAVGAAQADLDRAKDTATLNRRMNQLSALPQNAQQAVQTIIRTELEAQIADSGELSNDLPFMMNEAYRRTVESSEARKLLKSYGLDDETIRGLVEASRRSQNAQSAQEVQEGISAISKNKWGAVPAWMLARGMNLTAGIAGTTGVVQEMINRLRGSEYSNLDPNNPMYTAGRIAGAVTQAQTEDMGAVGKIAYQGLTGIADNLLRVYAGFGTSLGSSSLAAMSSFQDAVQSASERGASPEQALLMGTINGGLELITEHMGYDKLLGNDSSKPKDVSTFKKLIRAAASQAGSEILEEETSFLGNLLADAAVMAEKSESKQKLNDMIASGMTYDEARAELFKELCWEAAETAITSAISGFGMSAVNDTPSYIRSLEQQADIGIDGIQTGRIFEPEEYALGKQTPRQERQQANVPEYTPISEDARTQAAERSRQVTQNAVAYNAGEQLNDTLQRIERNGGKASNSMADYVRRDGAMLDQLIASVPEGTITNRNDRNQIKNALNILYDNVSENTNALYIDNGDSEQPEQAGNVKIGSAKAEFGQTGTLSKETIRNILNDPEAVADLTSSTGMEIPTKPSRRNEAVRSMVESLFRNGDGNSEAVRTPEQAAEAFNNVIAENVRNANPDAVQQVQKEITEENSQQETMQTDEPMQEQTEKPKKQEPAVKKNPLFDRTTPKKTSKQVIAEVKERVQELRQKMADSQKKPETPEQIRFTKKSIRDVSKNIVDGSGRKLTAEQKAQFENIMDDVYRVVIDEKSSWDDIEAKIGEAAKWLDDNAEIKKYKDQNAVETLKELKGRKFSLNDQQIQNIAYEFGSMKEFRKAIKAAGIKIDSNGISLDSMWQELSGMHPEYFNSDTVDADMPSALADIISRISDTSLSEYDTASTVTDIMVAISDLTEQVKTTTRDNFAPKSTELGQVQRELKQEQKDRERSEKQMQRDFAKTEKLTDAEWEKAVKDAIESGDKKAEAYYKWALDIHDEFAKMFFEQAKRYENDIDGLQRELKKLAKQNERDGKIMEQEFNRLLSEYEKADNKANKLKERLAYIKKMEAQREEKRKVTALKGDIKETISAISKLLSRNDRKFHAPDSLKTAVTDSLTAFDTNMVDYDGKIEKLNNQLEEAVTNGDIDAVRDITRKIQQQEAFRDKKTNALNALREAYTEIGESNRPEVKDAYSQYISDLIDNTILEIGDTPISKMNSDQLKMVSDLYSEVYATIQKANKELKYYKNKTISEAAADARKPLEEMKDTKKKRNAVSTFFGINNMRPIEAANTIDSPAFQATFKNLMQGEDAQGKNIERVKTAQDEVYASHNVKKLGLDRVQSVDTGKGAKVDMSVSTMLAMYMYSKNESAMTHITGDGVQIETIGKRGKTERTDSYSFTEDAVNNIVNNVLTKEQKAFMDDYCETVLGLTAEMINEVSTEDIGVAIASMENYFPIFVAGKAEVNPTSIEQLYPSFMNLGALNSRKNASNAIVIGDFRGMAAKHAAQAITYNSFALRLDEFTRIMNNKSESGESLYSLIEKKYGKETARYFSTLAQDIVSGQETDARAAILNKAISNAKSARTMANISTVAQQPTAIVRAFPVIDPKFFIGNRIEPVEGIDGSYNQAKKFAGVATIKELGMHDIGLGRSVQSYLMEQELETGKEKVSAFFKDSDYRNEVISSLPGMADKATWVAIWEAAKRKAAATTNLTGDALLEEAGRIFTDAIQQTQVYDSVLSRSANMRSGDTAMKMATAFMAENTVSVDMVRSGARDIANAAKNGDSALAKQGASKIASVAGAGILNSAVLAVVRSVFRSFKDKDKTFTEKLAANFVGAAVDQFNPLNSLPYTREIYSLLSGYGAERMDVSLVSDMVSKMRKLGNVMDKDTSNMTDEEKGEFYEEAVLASLDLAGTSVSMFSGVNPYLLTRDMYGMAKTMTSAIERDTDRETVLAAVRDELSSIPYLGKFFSDSNVERLYDAYKSGDKAYIQMAQNNYNSEKSLEEAERKALRDFDPRIVEAANALEAKMYDEADRIMGEISKEGIFRSKIIKGAVDAEVEARKPKSSRDYTPEQWSMIADLRDWDTFSSLPTSIQAKAEELVQSKDGFEKYSTPEEFTIAAVKSSVNSQITDIQKAAKSGGRTTAFYNEVERIYQSAKSVGLVRKTLEVLDGGAEFYFKMREMNVSESIAQEVYNGFLEISGMKDEEGDNEKGKFKENEWSAYLDSLVEDGDLNRNQRNSIFDDFGFYNRNRIGAKAYNDKIYPAIGDSELALAYANAISSLEPVDGSSGVALYQKLGAVLRTNRKAATEQQREAAVRSLLTTEQNAKLDVFIKQGMNIYDFVVAMELKAKAKSQKKNDIIASLCSGKYAFSQSEAQWIYRVFQKKQSTAPDEDGDEE